MKYCVMSVALPVNLALCPQPVLPPKRAMGGGRGGNRRNDCLRMQPLPALQAKDVWTTILALAAVAGTLSWWWARSALISRNSRRGGSLAAWPGVVAGNVFIGRDA